MCSRAWRDIVEPSGEIMFGVDAVVTRPGRVEIGATVERG